jgi:nitrogen regulatory protein P-II 1
MNPKTVRIEFFKHFHYINKKQFLIIIKRSAMKKIEAIIRRSKYSDVKEALHQAGVNFFSYWDVTGIGNEQRGHVYRGISYSTSEIQRRFLSIVVNDDFVQPTIDAILKSGATDKVGDGKIFILPVEEAYRIRTGDKGTDSLN